PTSLITLRTRSSRSTQALAVISPPMIATPVLTMVSQATRASLSSARMASSTASEICSASLTGSPSDTDSDMNMLYSLKSLVLGKLLKLNLKSVAQSQIEADATVQPRL